MDASKLLRDLARYPLSRSDVDDVERILPQLAALCEAVGAYREALRDFGQYGRETADALIALYAAHAALDAKAKEVGDGR